MSALTSTEVLNTVSTAQGQVAVVAKGGLCQPANETCLPAAAVEAK